MTTTPSPYTDDPNVPRWFHEFALANAAQHAELRDYIASVEVQMAQLETRLIRWMVASVMAAAGSVAGILVALNAIG